MYFLFLAIATLLIIISSMYFLASRLNRTQKSSKSNFIIKDFEPDNIAPSLQEMLEFHKKNGVVKYKIQD